MSFEIKREALIQAMKDFVQKCVSNEVTEISEHNSSNMLKPDDEFQFNLNTHYNGYVDEVSVDGVLMSNEGNHYDYETLGMEQLCELFDHLKSKYTFVGEEEENELTDNEKSGVVELINFALSERAEMEFLSYTELLNLKGKILK